MTDTIRTTSALQAIFADGQPAGSITPQDVRDMIVTNAPKPLSSGSIVYVEVNGNDSNDGLTIAGAKATILSAISAISASVGYGTIKLGYGTFLLTSSLIIPQAIHIEGMGPLPSQGTVIQWNGPDDGTYAIVTANNASGSDDSMGSLKGFRLQCSSSYSLANGINWRNAQNMAHLSDIVVGDGSGATGTHAFPGIGIYVNGANGGIPLNAFPGFCSADRVWSTGNGVNWMCTAGFTSVLFNMCAGDIGTKTSDVFIINNPATGSRGKDGNLIFIGFKSEDNGTPVGSGSTANYFTVNSDVGLSFIGCSAKKGSPVSKPWINYTVTASSANSPAGGIPVTLNNCSTQNILTAVQGPGGASLLAPTIATGGEVFQISYWNGNDVLPKKQYAPSRVSSSLSQVETVPRYGVATSVPVAGVVYLARISLQPTAYTTLSIGVSSAGSVLANAYVGLYDPNTLALVASSSNVATALQSAGVITATMNYTPSIAQDYYVAFLVGSATTMPTIAVSGIAFAGMAVLSPIIAHRHNTTGLTTLPNPAVLMTSPSGLILPWIRYE